ncbi:unnamed protein product [Miscanthus lutarioriparius]|uniref:ARM repeat superfamily protein n=1 Tax=Miscanthus lutarioriparius TaxID=422564 RepID=A0A811QPI8_9POAL|nr:unnamed protein product [Miscanthus lutarioriparius]
MGWCIEGVAQDYIFSNSYQIPAAIARVVLPLIHLRLQYDVDTNNPSKTNMVPTLNIFYGMVINEVAKSLLVDNSPGIVQNVSLLLDWGHQHKRVNPLLDTNEEEQQQNDLFVNATGDKTERGDEVLDTGKLLETQEHSTQQIGNSNEHNFWIVKWWRQVSELWSVPHEGPLTEQDLLSVIGMSIIQSLATYEQSNCAEISKATDLMWKITRFTSFCRSDTRYTEAEKMALVHSSLKQLYRKLSEILGDITSHYETRKLAAEILRNLAIDANMRQGIGRGQRIIARLMHVFLTPGESSSSINACVSHSREALRKVAGQALAMLAIGNVGNCLAMLRQTGYSFIEELTTMVHVERYRCVAASLLRSVCMHARPELKETDLKQLCYISRVVSNRAQLIQATIYVCNVQTMQRLKLHHLHG